jgi:hypothetical protein
MIERVTKAQGWWLDALGLALVLLAVSALDWCWLRQFLASLLRVVYRKHASMRDQHKCNAWGVKSGMLHDQAQLNYVNPYKPFTNLPLSFLVF